MNCRLCNWPGAALCERCLDDIPSPDPACEFCHTGLAVPAPRCGICLDWSIPARVACPYGFPLDQLLGRFKYQRELSLLPALSAILRRIALPDDDWLCVPVPLHRQRLAERGFNQAALLAKSLAQRRGWSYAPDGLLRLRHTPPQVGLQGNARRANVEGVFRAQRWFASRPVLIVDDVITTGATLQAAGQVVRQAGASRIVGVAVARAGYAASA
ncbi:MAG: ComF family protein [Pseudomonadota bacterium]